MKNTPLYTLLLTIFIDLVGFSIIIPILPVYSKEIGASNIMVGVIAGSYALMNFLFSPIWGNLSDRIGRKPVILISLFITACSYLLFAFSKTLTLLLISRVIAGIGSANFGAAQAYITDITKPEESKHPITRIPIVGFEIPFWKETIAMVKEAALLHPQNRSIGWDIVITESGPGFIEDNHDWCKLLWQLPAKKGMKSVLEAYKKDYVS